MKQLTYYIKYKLPFLPVLLFIIVALVGMWNLTRTEGVSFRSYIQHRDFSDKSLVLLSQNVIVSGEFIATEPQLGIVSFRFQRPDTETTASVVFRIKEKGSKEWYYEHAYTENQLHVYDWYPFGFPMIEHSGGKTYQFELKGISERNEDAVLLLQNRGYLVQYLLPNERLFIPFYRIFLLLQDNMNRTVTGKMIIYGGFLSMLFLFSFFSHKLPIIVKKIIMISIFLFVFYWRFYPYQAIQISTVCIFILTAYSGVLAGVLDGAKILILSGAIFAFMSFNYIRGHFTTAERLAEWTYYFMCIGLIVVLTEIYTKSSKNMRNKLQ